MVQLTHKVVDVADIQNMKQQALISSLIEVADVVVVNKMDLQEDSQLDPLPKEMMHPNQTILKSSFGKDVDLNELLDCHWVEPEREAFGRKVVSKSEGMGLYSLRSNLTQSGKEYKRGSKMVEHQDMHAFSWTMASRISLHAFQDMLVRGTYLRVKGQVRFAGVDCQTEFQLSGRTRFNVSKGGSISKTSLAFICEEEQSSSLPTTPIPLERSQELVSFLDPRFFRVEITPHSYVSLSLTGEGLFGCVEDTLTTKFGVDLEYVNHTLFINQTNFQADCDVLLVPCGSSRVVCAVGSLLDVREMADVINQAALRVLKGVAFSVVAKACRCFA